MGLMDFVTKPLDAITGGKKAERLSKDQMNFQERMSNTAYQRATEDLEKAGLNRILALGSPASTPPGSMPSVPNYLESAVSTAKGASGLASDRQARKLMVEQQKATAASAKQSLSQAKLNDENSRIRKTIADLAATPEGAVKLLDQAKGAAVGGFDTAKSYDRKIQQMIGELQEYLEGEFELFREINNRLPNVFGEK